MRRLGILLIVGSLMLTAACGGGSSGGGSSSGGGGGGGTSTITSVAASCSPSTVQSGQTGQCSATVMGTGSFSSAVTWSTNAGQISSSGLLTAPIVVSGSTSVTVTATSAQDATKSGATTDTVTSIAAANNVAPIVVDAGPPGLSFISADVPFVTIQVCVPGSTTQCQTIDHVTVDTGSSGLRIVSSVLNIALPQADDSSDNPLDECLVFEDGYVWGPVATADIYVAGEKASSVPVQITIPATSSPPVPSSCSSQSPPGGNGNEGGSVDAFGANALIGAGLFQQDCGPGCTSGAPDFYYGCPASGCNPTNVALAQQVANPVAMFTTDNNGVLVQLSSVPDGGSLTANGFLVFGIGTQSNNALGSSMVYPVPDTGNNAGDFTTLFNGVSYPQSFIDSGSNGLFFADSNIAVCPSSPVTPPNTWFCPANSPDSLTAVNQGSNGQSGSTTHFSVENTINLFNTNNTAFSTLGGPNSAGSFDWGLSFFFGRDVFTAIENMGAPGGTAPYYAYNLP